MSTKTRQRRRYTDEFKRQVVAESFDPEGLRSASLSFCRQGHALAQYLDLDRDPTSPR